MKIINKITFEAKDDAEALRTARDRLGKDAVILSSRPIKTGGFLGLFFKKSTYLVTAGIFDEDLKDTKREKKEKNIDTDSPVEKKERLAAFQKLLEFQHATRMNTPLIAPPAQVNYSNNYANTTSNMNLVKDIYQSSVARTSAPNEEIKQQNTNASFLEIRGEVNLLSEKFSSIVKKLNEHSYMPQIVESREFLDETYENFYKTLINSEMSTDYAKKIVNEFMNSKQEETFEEWLSKKVNVASTDPIQAVGGKRIAFIGPTGVGKTTTIAKLATIFSLWEHKRVLLLTSDTFRIAAVEQLKTYAKILGIPIEVVFDPDGINEILENYDNTDIILLDTAGRNQKDSRHIESFSSLLGAFRPDAVHLVLAANMKSKDMLDVIDKVSPLGVSHLVLTKLDETTSYGAIFDVADKLGKPLSFFTAGQNVPNDIEVASGEYLCKMILNANDDKIYKDGVSLSIAR
jgi:flagellar biosynthesis protein FlhF